MSNYVHYGQPSSADPNTKTISDANPLPVNPSAGTSGGCTPYSNLDVQNTGVTPIKASAGQLYHLFASNQANADRWLKVYDKGSAATSGDTPVLRYKLPALASGTLLAVPTGVVFANGIAIRACVEQADGGNTAPTASDVTVDAAFK